MNREEARKRAEELVNKMTLEEKASQLRYDAPAIERLGIPAYNWWNEALHGVARAGTATVFPQAIGMAAAFDPDMMEEIGAAIADEARAKYNTQSARGGEAVAGILFGDLSPSGKLPVTFYRSCGELPPFEEYSMKGRTYRYFDREALYPFGYGLTYGNCAAKALSVKTQPAETFDDVAAYVSVTAVNSGEAAEDVLQVYIRDEEYAGTVPNPSLCGFARIRLEKGECREVTIPVRLRAFTSVDEQGRREVRSRRFRVWAGFSQPDARSEELTGNPVVSQAIEL